MTSFGKWFRRIALSLLCGVIVLVAAGRAFELIAERADRRFKPRGELVDVGGRRMHITCTGAGSPTVVLEPGSGQFSLLVEPLQRRIAAFTRVCSYDRAGYGWSDPAPHGRGFDQRARDLEVLLARGGVPGPYVLVGASYGGFLVRSFARRRPDKVAGMVLVDAAEEGLVYSNLPLFHRAESGQRLSVLLAQLGVGRFTLARMAAQARREGRLPEARSEDIAAAVALAARPSAVVTALDEHRAFAATPARERRPGGLGDLGDRPLIVIRHGLPFSGINAPLQDLEPGWLAAQARLAALSTDSRMILAAENGHDIAQENPALVANAVRTVIAAIRSGKPLTPR
jgi:pimeloyl-ACP methyl ester carboxylesterase